MKPLIIQATVKTPKIVCDAEKGIIEFSGRSIPENAIEFYKPVLSWLDAYIVSPASQTQVNVTFDYYNTSSSKYIFDIFLKLETLAKTGHRIIVNWHYEEDDNDMYEAGKSIESLLSLPFNMVRISGAK